MSTAAIEGEMLLFFPEHYQTVVYFDQQPLINNGWDVRTDISNVVGILQNTGVSVRDNNGNIVRVDTEIFWSHEALVRGRFLDIGGTVYRLGVSGADWPRQGGFYIYDLEKLVGTQDSNTTEPAWQLGGTLG